jgi:glycosyltransferase involved in cell wall biosynthesis
VFDGKRVGVVVPAYDEEELIGATLEGIAPLVDRIIVVNDGSSDRTAEVAQATGDGRVEVISHERRSGVGAATVTGYRRALADGMDVVVVMNGDNQMDPEDLPKLVAPVARGELDYAKANRLATGQAWQLIPKTRFFGNAILSMLTKVASGYWHVADSQSGYTAVSREMLELLDLDHIYTNYGFPNDMLVHLNVWNARVRDFPSRPIYGVGERSNMRYRHVVPRIAWLLVRSFFWRLWEKYVKRDFHPLVFFYVMGFIATVAGVLLGLVVVAYRIAGYSIPVATVVLIALLVISGLQFTLFAMWFDMESNKDLK